jgi:hypothetical protein
VPGLATRRYRPTTATQLLGPCEIVTVPSLDIPKQSDTQLTGWILLGERAQFFGEADLGQGAEQRQASSSLPVWPLRIWHSGGRKGELPLGSMELPRAQPV